MTRAGEGSTVQAGGRATSGALCMLRVYVRRGETRPGTTLWSRIFPRELSA